LTFVEAEYCRKWHIFVDNEYVPRGVHISGVFFGTNACYHVYDWGPLDGHGIAYLGWFGRHADSFPQPDFSFYPCGVSNCTATKSYAHDAT